MLKLTRNPRNKATKTHEDERKSIIQVGDSITIHILKSTRGSVSVGVDAPDGVRIVRGEIADRKCG